MDRDQIIGYLETSLKKHKGIFKREDERRIARQIRERRKFGVIANLAYSRYDLVRKTVEEAGFTIKDDENLSDAFLVWTDNFLPLEKIMSLKSYQRLNHFPGMVEICRKDFLAKNFVRMNRIEPVEYSFMPKTWVLPQEHGFFLNYARRAANRNLKPTFILKPANGAMGHGIRLYRNAEQVPINPMNGTPCVVQEYINNPLLIDGYKCDLRVYVLVTSCDPLRVYIYNDGLVRLGAEKYVDPSAPNGKQESVFMHLTNYAVNKRHAEYNRSSDEMISSKRSFSFLNQYLRKTRQVDPMHIWRNIRELIVKTVAIATPHLLHSYRMCRRGRTQLGRAFSLETVHAKGLTECNSTGSKTNLNRLPYVSNLRSRNPHNSTSSSSGTPARSQRATSQVSTHGIAHFLPSHFFEILGFDILLDDELKPWLIEVNRSPSFNGDQELDRRVKHGLLTDTLRLLNIRPSDKEQAEKEQRLTACRRLYTSSTSGSTPIIRSIGDRTGLKQKTKLTNTTGDARCRFPGSTNTQSEVSLASLSNYAVEQQISRLKQHLLLVRQRLALEFFEYHNCGNWSLLFPTEDPVAKKRFASFILKNFSQFHNGKGGELQKEMEATYLHPVTEDEILDRLNELTKNYSSWPSAFDHDQNHGDLWPQDPDNYRTGAQTSSSDDSASTRTGPYSHSTDVHKLQSPEADQTRSTRDTIGDSFDDSNDKEIVCNTARQLIRTLKQVDPIIETQSLRPTPTVNVLVDTPELTNVSVQPVQPDQLKDTVQLTTLHCSIPLYHYNFLPTECTKWQKPSSNSSSRQTTVDRRETLQQGLDRCIDLNAYYSCVKRLVKRMSSITLFQPFQIVNELQKHGNAIRYHLRSQSREFRLVDSLSRVQRLVYQLALKSFQAFIAKIYEVITDNPRLSMTVREAWKLLRGIRIVRILERVHARLLRHHGELFLPLFSRSVSGKHDIPLLTEPVLECEEQCCQEFLRLCVEYTLSLYKQTVQRQGKQVKRDPKVVLIPTRINKYKTNS